MSGSMYMQHVREHLPQGLYGTDTPNSYGARSPSSLPLTNSAVQVVCGGCSRLFAQHAVYFCAQCMEVMCLACCDSQIDSLCCMACLKCVFLSDVGRQGRCASCLACPRCQHRLQTTSHRDGRFLLMCGLCRWESGEALTADTPGELAVRVARMLDVDARSIEQSEDGAPDQAMDRLTRQCASERRFARGMLRLHQRQTMHEMAEWVRGTRIRTPLGPQRLRMGSKAPAPRGKAGGRINVRARVEAGRVILDHAESPRKARRDSVVSSPITETKDGDVVGVRCEGSDVSSIGAGGGMLLGHYLESLSQTQTSLTSTASSSSPAPAPLGELRPLGVRLQPVMSHACRRCRSVCLQRKLSLSWKTVAFRVRRTLHRFVPSVHLYGRARRFTLPSAGGAMPQWVNEALPAAASLGIGPFRKRDGGPSQAVVCAVVLRNFSERGWSVCVEPDAERLSSNPSTATCTEDRVVEQKSANHRVGDGVGPETQEGTEGGPGSDKKSAVSDPWQAVLLSTVGSPLSSVTGAATPAPAELPSTSGAVSVYVEGGEQWVQLAAYDQFLSQQTELSTGSDRTSLLHDEPTDKAPGSTPEDVGGGSTAYSSRDAVGLFVCVWGDQVESRHVPLLVKVREEANTTVQGSPGTEEENAQDNVEPAEVVTVRVLLDLGKARVS